jgi:hypothetical protein
MPGRGQMGVMNIIPTFTKGQDGKQSLIDGIILCFNPTGSPHIISGIDRMVRVAAK